MHSDTSKEEKLIKEFLGNLPQPNQIWYTINTSWWKNWKKYVSYDKKKEDVILNDSPGPIDNSCLLEDGIFKKDCSREFDFELVPESVWTMLVEKYGLSQTDVTVFQRFVIKEADEFIVECSPLTINLSVYGECVTSNTIVKQFSRMSKLVDVEKFVQAAFNIPEGAVFQMIQECDNRSMYVMPRQSDTMTLVDAGVSCDQNVFVDVRNSEGEFSFKENRTNFSISKGAVKGGSSSVLHAVGTGFTSSLLTIDENGAKSDYSAGVCGLSNLGNTCFMNSAIQCISNVPILTNYFLKHNWNADLNKENPLGMGGRIATAYANLIAEMWSGTTAYSLPRDFKNEVAQFAPQFSGYSQHDSQELMMFLLDGLHEDLNRVTVKPYVEQKNPDNQPDQTVADDNWRYHLQRNNSIIVDYFHGQLKSKVVCPDCNFVSVTFDPFASLSLPLRHSYYQSVIFYPLDPMSPVTNLSVSLYKNSLVETLRDIVLKEMDYNQKNELLIARVRKFKVQSFIGVSESLSSIPSDDQIVMYEVEPLQSDHCYIEVVFKEKCMNSNLCLPLIIQMHKRVNWLRFMSAIKPSLPRFLNESVLKNDTEVTDGNGGDAIDFIDTQSLTDDHHESSDNDKSESVSNSSMDSLKVASNPFEHIFTAILFETLTTSSNGHEINPLSRTRSLKIDGSVAAQLCTVGSEYVIVEWTAGGLKYSKDIDTIRVTCNQEISKPTVEDCLQQFLGEEFLGQQDLWFCPKCKKDQAASKKLDIWRLPKVLVLHLKRFKATSYFGDKINSDVLFPVRNLDLTEYVPHSKNGTKYVYDLVAVSNHVGCLAGGHYFAYAKNCVNNTWYKFDDSATSPVDESEIVTKSAYVLVYMTRSCVDSTLDYNHNASNDMDVDEPE